MVAEPTSMDLESMSLRLERFIKASPERVFDAWTKPELMAKWFGPSDDYPFISAHADTRVGGSYRFELGSPDGSRHVCFGVYRAVDRPTLLSMTWAWESPVWKGRESHVTIEFKAEGEGTRVIVLHESLLDEPCLKDHGEGWNGSLDRLEKLGPELASADEAPR
ncbi:MAG: SRPBCC domain-containing protein [Planctomycetota bacterium]